MRSRNTKGLLVEDCMDPHAASSCSPGDRLILLRDNIGISNLGKLIMRRESVCCCCASSFLTTTKKIKTRKMSQYIHTDRHIQTHTNIQTQI